MSTRDLTCLTRYIVLCLRLLPADCAAATATILRSPREIVPTPDGTASIRGGSHRQPYRGFRSGAPTTVNRHIGLARHAGRNGGFARRRGPSTSPARHPKGRSGAWMPDGRHSPDHPGGAYPGGRGVDPEGTTLYVCNQFDHDVSVVDLVDGREVARIPVRREPVAAALTPGRPTTGGRQSSPRRARRMDPIRPRKCPLSRSPAVTFGTTCLCPTVPTACWESACLRMAGSPT